MRRWRDFSGRSRRSEYWWTIAFFVVLITALMTLDVILIPWDYPEGYPFPGFSGYWQNWLTEIKVYPISGIVSYILLIPILAVSIRRMHDVGRSGWWMIIPTVMVEIATYWGGGAAITEEFLVKVYDSDTVLSGGFWAVSLFAIILVVLTVVSIIFAILDSRRAENKYGPSPKYGSQKAVFD